MSRRPGPRGSAAARGLDEQGRDGYIAGAFYPCQYHEDLDPVRHAAALLAVGRSHRNLSASASYLELGCGSGFTLVALAAAHPHVQFTGVDIDAGHVAALGTLAEDAGLENLNAVCGDLASPELLERGPFDTVAAHGLWSWVSPRVRGAIVALLQSSLRSEGVFYVSYNALPGMAALEPLRDLLRLGEVEADAPMERVGHGIGLLRAMTEVGAAFLDDPRIGERLAAILASEPAYLAHEYMNAHWRSFYHREVAEVMREADLSFACSTRPANDMDDVRFDPPQRALLDRTSGPGERETLRDFFTNRTFRTDLFVGKTPPASRNDLEEQVVQSRFVCVKPEHEIPAGAPDSYRAVLDVVLAAPASHANLSHDPRRERGRLDAIVHHLLAMDVVGLALPAIGQSQRTASIRRFNDVVLRRAAVDDYLPGLVSPVTGAVVPLAHEELSRLALVRDTGHHVARLHDDTTSALLHRLDVLS